MGIYADLLANAKAFDTGGADGYRIGSSKALVRQIKGLMAISDPEYPAAHQAKNEVQSIAIFGGSPSAGNFTLTFSLRVGDHFVSYTTANIAYDGNTAAILSAVNTALAAHPSWTNGDVAVSGGPLTTTPVVLTFSGASVSGQNQGLVTIDASGVTGGTAGAVSVTTSGQTLRTAWAALKMSGAITSDPPAQGVTPTSVTAVTAITNPHRLDQDAIKDLARQAAFEDKNPDVYTEIVAAFGWE